MILLIDAGNTRVKWALVAADAPLAAWLATGAVPHAELEQLPAVWQRALANRGVTRALLANVAGAALRERLERILPAGLAEVAWFASLPELAGVRNGYRNPAQLGCDRFAAAIGAHALAPGRDVIVATCGTATTIDAVTADGAFLGGMILPGLGLMASALARNTAQLPQIAQDGKLPAGFADNTDDAILSGCLAAQSGAIEHACALHGASLCLISGGAAPFVAPMLKVPYRVVDNIVLTGLHAASGALPVTTLDSPC
ncbi:type III pantothenate kinase [Rugamonas apoptosis]|uniref:Type III pantothenate kinase n=1 Tax=Rugamonas apoptosis TaxID=2758570 RepID=A0A7W2FBK7_9BURK|nr:type III pantothenate kinase [Rugamonas apoptosis]MBA5688584.1 type III pantothenate kinase [Rugamonas apoptosis]